MGLVEFKAKQIERMAAVALPDLPDDVVAAEKAWAEIKADLETANADFENLNMNFRVVELQRADGSLFPYGQGSRDELLVSLYRRRTELAAAQETARRILDDARRSFSEKASKAITPAADAVCEQAIEHIDAALNLIDMLQTLNTDASKSGLNIRHPQVARAAGISRQLYDLRRVLAPACARR